MGRRLAETRYKIIRLTRCAAQPRYYLGLEEVK